MLVLRERDFDVDLNLILKCSKEYRQELGADRSDERFGHILNVKGNLSQVSTYPAALHSKISKED